MAQGARLRRGARATSLLLRLPRPAAREHHGASRQRGRAADRETSSICRVRPRHAGLLPRRRLRRRGMAAHGTSGLGRALVVGARVRVSGWAGVRRSADRSGARLMFGPRIDGGHGTSLRPPTKEDYEIRVKWQLEPETTRFWGPRFWSR